MQALGGRVGAGAARAVGLPAHHLAGFTAQLQGVSVAGNGGADRASAVGCQHWQQPQHSTVGAALGGLGPQAGAARVWAGPDPPATAGPLPPTGGGQGARKRTREGGPTAVADNARGFLVLMSTEVVGAHAGDDVATAHTVAQWIGTLHSNRLVSESRREDNPAAAHVLLLLNTAKAKAKPVLRTLYAMVGQAGKSLRGLATAADLYQELGFQYLHQNSVTKDEAVKRLLAACEKHPAVVAAALAGAMHRTTV